MGFILKTSPLWLSGSSYLVGEGVDSLLQVVVLRVQQRRLLSLKGAVGVGVLSELADHGELWKTKPGQIRKSIIQPVFCLFIAFVLSVFFLIITHSATATAGLAQISQNQTRTRFYSSYKKSLMKSLMKVMEP